MRVLVLGGTGFIGSYITRQLVDRGHQVHLYDLNPGGSLGFVFDDAAADKLPFTRGDVTDWPLLAATVRAFSPERIVHLAAMLKTPASANPHLAVRVNCEGTSNVFEIARLFGVPRVVWASSSSVFGNADRYPEGVVRDDSPHYPKDLYGACKSFNEKLAQQYFETYQLDTIGIRVARAYGMGAIRGANSIFTDQLFVRPALGQPGLVPLADTVCQFTYVEDVARSFVQACLAPPTKHRAFNLRGDLRSIRDAIALVKRLLPQAVIDGEAGRDTKIWNYDATGAQAELEWQPEYSLEAGALATMNMARRRSGLPELAQ